MMHFSNFDAYEDSSNVSETIDACEVCSNVSETILMWRFPDQ